MGDFVIVECWRYRWVSRLRKRFQTLWKEVLGCKPPNEAFNGWFFEGLARRRPNSDSLLGPILVSPASHVSVTLLSYVLLRKPVELKYPNTKEEAIPNLREYLSACELVFGDEERDLFLQKQETVWRALDLGWATVLSVVRAQLHPFVGKTLEGVVKNLGEKLASAVLEIEEDIAIERAAEVDLPSQICVHQEVLPTGMIRFRVCKEDLPMALRNQNLLYDLNPRRVEQLKLQFGRVGRNGAPSVETEKFEEQVWCMLHRYQSLYGSGGVGAGWQLATPHEVMAILRDEFHVSHECFASPLNCFLPSFCSVFPDTDHCFGSKGRFSESVFQGGGSFQAGPPYDTSIMRMLADAICSSLETVDGPLSIVCVLPDWDRCEPIERLKGSKFNRASFSLAKESHRYLNGFQHFCKSKHLYVRFECATYVCWMQNDTGFDRWKPVEDLVCKVQKSWSK
ncbi:hypothetical protein BSKO_00448 [Bryopsis sp. KO-2023]|nr:hypothetical protein BSKO_00448 [Bryopsis sp. KO-2023]